MKLPLNDPSASLLERAPHSSHLSPSAICTAQPAQLLFIYFSSITVISLGSKC